VRVAVTGCKSSVFRVPELESALSASFTADAAKAVSVPVAGINGDMHGTAEYRAAMISVMASRAVTLALSR
jgi:carbon-monoxide dehydrogenase medium subunit